MYLLGLRRFVQHCMSAGTGHDSTVWRAAMLVVGRYLGWPKSDSFSLTPGGWSSSAGAVEAPSQRPSEGPRKQPPPKRSQLFTAQLSCHKYALMIKENRSSSDQIILLSTASGHWERSGSTNTDSQICCAQRRY